MARKGPNLVDVHVGGRVRLRRMLLGMSQEKLADRLGITFQQIQKYEKGANRIGASRLQQISQALDTPIAFFFEDLPDSGDGRKDVPETGRPYVMDFLATSEGLELNKAFARISDAKVRRKVVELVRTLAGEEA